MFYLRFIGTVHFHKSWNAPTAKYSCPQLHAYVHHNYYARYPLRALSQLYSPPRITCSQERTVLYSIHLSTFHCRTCLFEKDLQSRSFVKFDDTIRSLTLCVVFRFSFLFLDQDSHGKITWFPYRISLVRNMCIEYYFFSRMCSLLNINPGLLQATTI